MKNEKEQLEMKILSTIQKIKTSPIGEKQEYVSKLRKYGEQYKELTGEYFTIE